MSNIVVSTSLSHHGLLQVFEVQVVWVFAAQQVQQDLGCDPQALLGFGLIAQLEVHLAHVPYCHRRLLVVV